MAVIGTQKQEEKILEMGNIAHELAPKVSVMNFKGAFRLGIKQALKQSGNAQWKDLSQKSNLEKKQFFDQILNESKPHLIRSGLSEQEVEKICVALKKKNDEYLHRP